MRNKYNLFFTFEIIIIGTLSVIICGLLVYAKCGKVTDEKDVSSEEVLACQEDLEQEIKTDISEETGLNEEFLVLVNEKNPLSENYEPQRLVLLEEILNPSIIIKQPNMLGVEESVIALNEMLSDAIQQGITNWQISDSYRSIRDQQEIWDATYQKYITVNGLSENKALQATARRVAKPGCSEHHTGLSYDINVPGQSFRLTEQCEWLNEHCWDYGFIIRYTAEKESITGITAEPWHIRFTGKEAAQEILNGNMCLEEYLNSRGIEEQ